MFAKTGLDVFSKIRVNSSPAESGYTLPLQIVRILIRWILQKPTDLYLHCLGLSILNCIDSLYQLTLLADNWKWVW